jgi:hypothetical protein
VDCKIEAVGGIYGERLLRGNTLSWWPLIVLWKMAKVKLKLFDITKIHQW